MKTMGRHGVFPCPLPMNDVRCVPHGDVLGHDGRDVPVDDGSGHDVMADMKGWKNFLTPAGMSCPSCDPDFHFMVQNLEI